jgi:hypothetical protein
LKTYGKEEDCLNMEGRKMQEEWKNAENGKERGEVPFHRKL